MVDEVAGKSPVVGGGLLRKSRPVSKVEAGGHAPAAWSAPYGMKWPVDIDYIPVIERRGGPNEMRVLPPPAQCCAPALSSIGTEQLVCPHRAETLSGGLRKPH